MTQHTAGQHGTGGPEAGPQPGATVDPSGTSAREVIAVVGLGNMGGPMAANLVQAGHPVLGFDLNPEALERARETGVEAAASGAEAAAGASIVITMLPAGRHVLAAYQGGEGSAEPDGLLGAAKPGTVFVDCSTISVAEARQVHALAQAAGFVSLDCPVSGGVVGAEAGTLALMVGGEADIVERVMPVFEVVGRRVVHCGGDGAGQAAKACNNMILGISQIAVAEAFVLGERLGLDHQVLFDVAANATGQCWALTTNCPVPGPVPESPANQDYAPGFAGALMAKDLGLAKAAIEDTGTEGRMGLLAEQVYAAWAADDADGDGGTLDFSAIIQDIRERSGSVQPDAPIAPPGQSAESEPYEPSGPGGR